VTGIGPSTPQGEPGRRTSGAARAATIAPDYYLDFLRQEYLDNYIGAGGTAVKVVTAGDPEVLGQFRSQLAAMATAEGFLSVMVDAAESRLHLIDEIFVAMSRQTDWMGLAADVVRQAYADAGFPLDEGRDEDPAKLAIATVAERHQMHAGELYRDVRRALENAILRESGYVYEFRIAMLRLCQSLLGRGDLDQTERDTVLRWLCGHTVPLDELRVVGLYSRVAPHNARRLFTSLSRWVRHAGRPGMVVQLDLTRLAVARRPPVRARRGFYYPRSAVLDVFEILRQFVDACDEMSGVALVVLLPNGMIVDPSRGLPAYHALHLRCRRPALRTPTAGQGCD
jgi:hypothetical protein